MVDKVCEQDPVISYLLEEKILDEESLEAMLEKQTKNNKSLLNILRDEKLINEEQFCRLVALANNIEYVDLTADMVESVAAYLVPHEMIVENDLIPLRIENDKLIVAMSFPLDLFVRGRIESRTGYKVIPVAANVKAIRKAVQHHFDVVSMAKQDIVSLKVKKLRGEETASHILHDLKRKATDTPVTRVVSSVIKGAIDARASDIHIEPQEYDLRVRYRIDGVLRDILNIPATAQREVASHIKVMANMDITERRIPQDGHLGILLNDKEYDLRISSLPSVLGEKIVIRILDKNTTILTLDDIIDMPYDNNRFRELIGHPHGMILLAGLTGSGKTTTLYSALQELSVPEKNIVTVEDPVEYHIKNITQIQVNKAVGMTFSSSLRSILRQDPDIILIGEIRDAETAEIAVSAALTGHLVLSTLHANDSAGVVSRLSSLEISPFMIASSVLGVMSQRLVRTICPECKEQYEPSEAEIEILSDERIKTGKDIKLYRGAGCEHCQSTGYYGRKAIYEIFMVSLRLKEMIRAEASDEEIKRQAIKEEMDTLRISGIKRVLAGMTTVEELLRVVDLRLN